MTIAYALIAVIAVFCGYLLFDKIMLDKRRRDSVRARLAPDGSAMPGYDDQPVVNLNGEPSPQAATLLKFLRVLGMNIEVSLRTIQKRFAKAGINSPDAPIYYIFFQRVVSLLLLLVAAYLVMNATPYNKLTMYSAGLLVGVIGLFGPKMYLQNVIDKRRKILQRSLPDTLDLLLICVESGLALDAALMRVCNEMGRAHPEMTGELNRTRLELTLLNDRVRALMNLSERTDMSAIRSLTSALIQSERFGTSLTDTLRVLSDEFRVQRLSDAEAKAARLPVLMTIPLIFLLMPAFFMIVLGPAIVKIMHPETQAAGKK